MFSYFLYWIRRVVVALQWFRPPSNHRYCNVDIVVFNVRIESRPHHHHYYVGSVTAADASRPSPPLNRYMPMSLLNQLTYPFTHSLTSGSIAFFCFADCSSSSTCLSCLWPVLVARVCTKQDVRSDASHTFHLRQRMYLASRLLNIYLILLHIIFRFACHFGIVPFSVRCRYEARARLILVYYFLMFCVVHSIRDVQPVRAYFPFRCFVPFDSLLVCSFIPSKQRLTTIPYYL